MRSPVFAIAGLVLLGAAACGTAEPTPGEVGQQTAAITANGMASGSSDATGIAFLYLPGYAPHCPEIAYVRDGKAYDKRHRLLGPAQVADLMDGRATNQQGGSNALTEDVFFNDVPEGWFTLCARPLDEAGVCDAECETARGFGYARPAHKEHVTLIMTCDTPDTQDIGAIAKIQNTPSVNLQGARETGLVGCGDRQMADLLKAWGVIESPDGNAAKYRVVFDGPPRHKVFLFPANWAPAVGGQFLVKAMNFTGQAIDVPVRIEAKTIGLDGRPLYADAYRLTFSWLDCE